MRPYPAAIAFFASATALRATAAQLDQKLRLSETATKVGDSVNADVFKLTADVFYIFSPSAF